MIDFTLEQDIARPPAEVFAYATDPAKLATWQTNTVSAETEDGRPLRLGSRLREVHRAPGGKQMPSTVEVSQWEPPHAFALTVIEGSLPIHAKMTFSGHAAGTRVAFTAHGQPSGAMRLLQPILARSLKRQFAAHLRELRGRLETAPEG